MNGLQRMSGARQPVRYFFCMTLVKFSDRDDSRSAISDECNVIGRKLVKYAPLFYKGHGIVAAEKPDEFLAVRSVFGEPFIKAPPQPMSSA